MEKTKVYMTDFRTTFGISMAQKVHKLMKAAGFESIDFAGKFVAIKMHFGELGNLAFLRPNYAKMVVDYVKSLGGKPFLTDCNTLYVGMRKNALDHLEDAYENGFSPFSTGCHIIIGDGLKGTDDVEVPVEGGRFVKSAKIGRAVMDADIFISLTHFKGHENAGIGGVLKNIGMGCGSRAGKMEMHSAGKPSIDLKKCVGCGSCAKVCGSDAITIVDKKAVIDKQKCTGCGRCIGVCLKDASTPLFDEKAEILNEKIAEYTAAVVRGRPCFHICGVMDVSPNCDCHSENDAPIVPDIGVFASFDPIALDQACADAILAASPNKNSQLGEAKTLTGDHFADVHPTTRWQSMGEAGERLGLGLRKYELIKVN